MFKQAQIKAVAEKAAREEARQKALSEFQTRFAVAQRLTDAGEQFLSLRKLTIDVKTSIVELAQQIEDGRKNDHPDLFTAFGSIATVGSLLVALGGLPFTLPVLGTSALAAAGIPTLAFGYHREAKKCRDYEENFRQPTIRFLSSLEAMHESIKTAAQAVIVNRLDELALSSVFEKAMEEEPLLRDAFAKKAARTLRRQSATTPSRTARERFGLGE